MSYYTLEINVEEDLKEKYNWYGVRKWDFAWTEKKLYDILKVLPSFVILNRSPLTWWCILKTDH